MKAKNHGVAIVEYENAFDAGNLIELIEQECSEAWGYLHWERSAVGEGDISNARTSMSCELSPLGQDDILVESVIPIAASWRKVWEQIEPYVWDYRNTFELVLQEDEGYRLLKYGGGAEYHAHHDHFHTNSRSLSLVAFVNDNYTGGELVFPRFNVTIKPKKGTIVLFPSNFPYLHIANPVGVGNTDVKYSLVTWFK